jgi:hypothetical protein
MGRRRAWFPSAIGNPKLKADETPCVLTPVRKKHAKCRASLGLVGVSEEKDSRRDTILADIWLPVGDEWVIPPHAKTVMVPMDADQGFDEQGELATAKSRNPKSHH